MQAHDPADGCRHGRRYPLIDMHVPPGGGPGPHRHDFKESFRVLDSEIEVTFRGQTTVARAGATVNIPANAPHRFTNAPDRPARSRCVCTAGNHTIHVMNNGMQEHEAVTVKLAPGKSMKYLDAGLESGMKGPSPITAAPAWRASARAVRMGALDTP